MEKIFFFFVKFGQRKYMERLLKNGELYLNTTTFFSQYDESNGIGDKYEGVRLVDNAPFCDIELMFNSPNIENLKLEKVKGVHMRIRENHPQGNIFCLNMANGFRKDDERVGKIELNASLLDLGSDYDTAVFIMDYKRFLERVTTELEKLPYFYKCSPVEYYDEKLCQGKELTFFHKRKKYSEQNEFRIYVETNSDSPLKINIGNMEDIAFLKELPK